MLACFHHMVSYGQSTTWRSPSLSRSNTWLLSSSWTPTAHLALFSRLWRYPSSDAVLTPAISSISGRLVESGSVLFIPVQIKRTCPLPPKNVTLAKKLCWSRLHSKQIPESGRTSQAAVSNTQNLSSELNYCWVKTTKQTYHINPISNSHNKLFRVQTAWPIKRTVPW